MCVTKGCPSFVYYKKDGPLGSFIGYKGLNKTVTKGTSIVHTTLMIYLINCKVHKSFLGLK